MDAPAVAGSADGKALAVVWMDRRRGDDDPNVYGIVVPWAANAAQAEEVMLRGSGPGKQTHPAIAMDADGSATAAWEDTGPGWQAIAIASMSGGRGGTTRVGRSHLASEEGEGCASFPAVAVARETAALAYETKAGVRVKTFRLPLDAE